MVSIAGEFQSVAGPLVSYFEIQMVFSNNDETASRLPLIVPLKHGCLIEQKEAEAGHDCRI